MVLSMKKRFELKIDEKEWVERGCDVETVRVCLSVGVGKGLSGKVEGVETPRAGIKIEKETRGEI